MEKVGNCELQSVSSPNCSPVGFVANG